MVTPTAASVWRKNVVDGVPASGPNQPDKAEIIAWGTFWEAMLGAGAGGLSFATLGLLSADLAHAANTTATVYADPVSAYNGLYEKAGVSGAGSWTRIGDLPNAVVRLTASGGTANAITADAPEVPVQPGRKLFLFTPVANNTGAVTINGAAVKNALGASLAANAFVTDIPVLMAWQTDHYQVLVSLPVDATGVLNDVLAAKAAAEAAAAALGNQVHQYDTRAQAAAATIPVGVAAIKITRHATSYPLCYATYIPGTSAGPMAFQEAGGHWWELDVSGNVLPLPWFGTASGGVINDSSAVQTAYTVAGATGKQLDGMGLVYKISATVTGASNVALRNATFGQAGQSAYPMFEMSGKTGWKFHRGVRFIGDGDPTINTASTWIGAINFGNSGSTDMTGIVIEECIFENFSGNYVINGAISGSGGIKNFCFRWNKVYSKVASYLDLTHILLSLYATGSFANAGGRWYDADISDNYVDAEGLTIPFTFWSGHTRTKARGNQIVNPGAHSLFNPAVGSHNCYGLIFYDAIGAAGNTTTCATDCEASGNLIQAPPSAGIYIATARRLNIHDNIITGQSRTDSSTLPRGGIALNDLRDSMVHHNKIEDCWGGINAVGTLGSETLDISSNVISDNGASDSFGIRLSAPVSTATASRVNIRKNDITMTGTSSYGIILAAASTAKHGPTAIVGNVISSPNIGIGAGGNYFNGDLIFRENRYRGVCGVAALDLHSVTSSGVVIEDEIFEAAATTGLCAYLDGTTNLAINGMTFLGKAGSSVCFQAAGGAAGCIDGFVFRGVAASLRVAAGSLGYALPSDTATPGDFRQNLNIDGGEVGSPGSKFIPRGWYFQTGTTWVTARQPTGN